MLRHLLINKGAWYGHLGPTSDILLAELVTELYELKTVGLEVNIKDKK